MRMGIINRYLTSEVLKFMGFLLLALITIYFAVDFFEKMDDFLENDISVPVMMAFFLLQVPFVITMMLPLCLLLSVLIVFGLMTRHNELLALRSSGVSPHYLISPVFLIGILSAMFMFILNEGVVPVTVGHANRIWNEKVKGMTAQSVKGENIWIKTDRSIVHIKYYNPAKKRINGITVYDFNDDFLMVRRLDALQGRFENGKWALTGVMEQQLKPSGDGYDSHFFEQRNEPIALYPEDLTRVAKKSEEMNVNELSAYIQKVEAEGYDATPYRVDLYAKTAFPLVCVLLCLIAVGISDKWRLRDNLPVSIAGGIGVALLYWVVNSLCISFGYGAILPPMVAAWAANVLFFCLSIFLFLSYSS